MSRRRLIVYVDGFNLYHGIHAEAGRRLLWLDLVALARSLRPADELIKVRYFTAPVLGDPGAESRQTTYLNALRAQNGCLVETVLGRYQSKKRTCRTCHASHVSYEEKETDVNIAVNLVVDAGRREMDSALLMSGDSDLAPAVRAARALNPGVFIAAAFPPHRPSSELRQLMSGSFMIGVNKIRQAQLPAKVTDGHLEFDRPQKWA